MTSAPSTPALLGVSSRGRYEHVDALRALAVMLVVVAHAGLGHVVPGGSGVTIFFAISGFIITHILLVEHERTGGFRLTDFYLRRVLKLAPPFLLLIALPTVVWAALGNHVDGGAFAAQIFFAFNWVYMQGVPDVLPGSAVVWSLAIEEQFYIVFALVWMGAVLLRRRLAALTALALATVVGALVVRLVVVASVGAEEAHRRVYYGTDTRADGIAFGILAAVVFAHARHGTLSPRWRRAIGSSWVPVLALALYLTSLLVRDPWFRETLRYSLQAIAAAAVILYGLERQDGLLRTTLGRVAGLRLVQVIGLASYAIYLAHLGVAVAVERLLPGLPGPVVFTLAVVAGTGLGVAVWFWVERPVEAYKMRLMRSRAAAHTARRAADAAPTDPPADPAPGTRDPGDPETRADVVPTTTAGGTR
ncbi:acyltransferase family protein [Cellulomonas sp. S1-8]|uniref:acyltransferase family protein n=1 Tax=Cellulomonas sp. S1-8 TaxID=2904790 RepID=UPI0022438A7C|nr:acyltransferase [Cellulomonas sp. S1-8]UZN04313.1 acyltransferase [Cellulomonas sp. S1-8]